MKKAVALLGLLAPLSLHAEPIEFFIITIVTAIISAGTGFVSASADAFATLGDYEEVDVKVELVRLDSTYKKQYFGVTHISTIKIFNDLNGKAVYERQTIVNGVPSPIDRSAFPISYAQQSRYCYLNANQWEQSETSTKMQLGYTVKHYANNLFLRFPDPTKVTVWWNGYTLPYGCAIVSSGYYKVEERTAARNGRTILPFPRGNVGFDEIPIDPHR
jgi:hypothetical protein